MGENKMKYEKIKEKRKELEEKILDRARKPLVLVIGPDGFVYSEGITSEAFDKRYFGR